MMQKRWLHFLCWSDAAHFARFSCWLQKRERPGNDTSSQVNFVLFDTSFLSRLRKKRERHSWCWKINEQDALFPFLLHWSLVWKQSDSRPVVKKISFIWDHFTYYKAFDDSFSGSSDSAYNQCPRGKRFRLELTSVLTPAQSYLRGYDIESIRTAVDACSPPSSIVWSRGQNRGEVGERMIIG